MIFRRIADGFRRQDWITVFIELLVVVIGLLLGLQLNDWSNTLQDRKLVASYYEQLVLDLEADVATGEEGIAVADRHLAMGEITYRAARRENIDDVSDAELVLALVMAGYSDRPFVTRHTYDELISTGRLRLIEDTTLKRALSVYYSKAAFARQWDELIQHEQTRYRDAIRGILTPAQMRWVRENLGGTTEPPPGFDREQFLKSLQARPEVVDSLAAMAAVQVRLRRGSEIIAQYADELIATLPD